MDLLRKYLLSNVLRAPEDGAGGGGGGGGDAAAAAAAAAAAGGGGGGDAKPFYSTAGLDADGVKFINDRKFDGWAPLVKSAIDSDRVARARNLMDKPDPNKLSEWKGYSELGWVEDATKYTIEKPKVGEGEVLHDGMFATFTKAAHAAKLAPWQAKAVFEEMFKFGNTELKNMDTASAGEIKRAEDALQAKWGADFPRNKTLAARAMRHFGLGAKDSKLLDGALGSPGLVEMFHAIGDMIGEDKLPENGGGGFGSGESIDAIEADKRKFAGDALKRKALGDPSHPQHKDVAAEWAKIGEREAAARRRANRAA